MKIGGLQKTTLIDYPGRIGAVIFTQGCNFRCPYCHNPDLVPGKGRHEIPQQEVLDFLGRRQGKLEAVTVTGGEPTLQPGLFEFLSNLRTLGYAVKLDTNGSSPEMLQAALNAGLVDYVAMDFKAPLARYPEVTRSKVDPEKIRKSIGLILSAGIDYEFRTTLVPALLSPADLAQMGTEIPGAKRYFLQRFLPERVLDPAFAKQSTLTPAQLDLLRQSLAISLPCVKIRT